MKLRFFPEKRKLTLSLAFLMLFSVSSNLVDAAYGGTAEDYANAQTLQTSFQGLLEQATSPQTLAAGGVTQTGSSSSVTQHVNQQLLAFNTDKAVTQVVYGPAPKLDPLPEFTVTESVTIKGSAAPGSTVYLSMSKDGGQAEVIDTRTLDAAGNGRFAMDEETNEEGEYQFTATATLNGQPSELSSPDSTTVDFTPPAPIAQLSESLTSYNAVHLEWIATYDNAGNPVDNPDIDHYNVLRDGGQLTSTKEKEYDDPGLAAGTAYCYEIDAVDRAGNMSPSSKQCIGTVYPNKIADLHQWSENDNRPVAFSRDGSTVAYADNNGDGTYLYVSDLTAGTGPQLISKPVGGDPVPNGYNFGAALSDNGKIVAFAAFEPLVPEDNDDSADIYVYDRGKGTLEEISNQADDASEPSISGDGQKLVYTDDNHIYLYNRSDRTTKDVSESVYSDYGSVDPVISGDGSTVAFVGYPIIGGPYNYAKLMIYDVATAQIKQVSIVSRSAYGLSINENGQFIAFTGNIETRPTPKVYSQADDSIVSVADWGVVQGKSYDITSISSDGRYVLANYGTFGSEYPNRSQGAQLFDQSNGTKLYEVGNTAVDTNWAAMDGAADKFVFEENKALYLECGNNADCGQIQHQDPIASVSWNVNDNNEIGGEIVPGSELSIRADGVSGEKLQATVTYETYSGPAVTTDPIALSESPGSPGIYVGTFDIPAGTVKITGLKAAPVSDATAAKEATDVPVNIAGAVHVTISTLYMAALAGDYLVVSSPTVGIVSQTVAVSQDRPDYRINLPAGTDYTVQLQDAAGHMLAEQTPVEITHANTTEVELQPAFPATVKVHVNGVQWNIATIPHVVISDAVTGNMLKDAAVDYQGNVVMDAKPGETLTIRIDPGDAYVETDSQHLEVMPGENDVTFGLRTQAAIIHQFRVMLPPGVYSEKVPTDIDLKLQVWADPGQSLQAKVSYRVRDSGGNLVSWDKLVELAPVTDGKWFSPQYEGVFHIDPGTAEVDSASLQVGGKWLPQPYSINKSVKARISLTTPNPVADGTPNWSGLNVIAIDPATYDSLRQHFYSSPLSGSGTQTIDLDGGPTYQLAESMSTYYYGESIISRTESFTPQDGELLNVTLTPSLPAALTGTTTDKDGHPVGSVQVKATDPDGSLIASGYSDASGHFRLGGLWTGANIHLQAVDSKGDYEVTDQDVNMAVDALDTPVTIAMQDHPKGTVSGQITAEDHSPSVGTKVTVSFKHAGLSVNLSATTDKQGRYSLEVPAGDVTIQAAKDWMNFSDTSAVTVKSGDNPAVDLVLINHSANIDVKLYTKYTGGEWQGPMDIDWRVAVHFGLSSDHPIAVLGNPLQVRAGPGESVKVCVNGAQAGLPSACQSVQIDANKHGTAEFRLEQDGGHVTGKVDSPDNGYKATFYHYYAQNQIDDVRTFAQNSSPSLEADLMKSGSYRVDITDSTGTNAGISKDFTLTTGQTVDLGELHLEPLGVFGGREGNSISVTPQQIAPGGEAEVYVSYADRMTGAKEVKDASVQLAIPLDITVNDKSLTLNGQPVEASLQNGLLTVQIGQKGTVSIGDTGLIHFRISLQVHPSSDHAAIQASIRYTDQGAKKEEQLGTSQIQLTPISLEAPVYVTSLAQVPLSGMAPADSQVSVYDGDTAIGQVTASSDGFWKLDAALPDTDGAEFHHLRAEATAGSEHDVTPDSIVRLDSGRNQLVSVSMSQPDGRVVTFDPTKGVARFPYVYIGGGFIFKLVFKDPNLVRNVNVLMNGALAEARNNDGVYEAYVNPTSPGPIWVQYDVVPDSEQATQVVQNEQQIKDSLPTAWKNYDVGQVSLPSGNGTAGTTAKAATIEADLTKELHASMSFSFERSNYAPTSGDYVQGQSSGVPVYGLSLTHQVDGDTMNISASAYVPVSALPKTGTAAAAMTLMAGALTGSLQGQFVNAKPKAVSIAGVNPELIKITIQLALKAVTENGKEFWDVYSNWSNIKSIFDEMHDPTFDRLQQLMDKAETLCDPVMRKLYEDQIHGLAVQALVEKATEWAVDIGAVFVGPETFGLGTIAVWAAGSLMKYALNSVYNYAVDTLAKSLYSEKNDCDTPPPPPGPDADPVFIQDPSGYVYEGIPANRLSGVTTTAMQWDATAGAWKDWDASWFEQDNPVTSDTKGDYGWFVPDGKWKVRFEKAGYQPAVSKEMTVPPPQYDVNVGMISNDPPAVVSMRAEPGGAGVEIGFSKPMLIDSFPDGGLTVADNNGAGANVSGTFAGIDIGKTDDRKDAAMTIRFTPDTPLTVGHTVQIQINRTAADYANVPLAAVDTRSVTVPAQDSTAPADPTGLSAVANDTQMIVTWQDPSDVDFAKVRLYWKKSGGTDAEVSLDIDKGVQYAELSGLQAGTAYQLRLAAVDQSGNESAGAPLAESTLEGANPILENVSDLHATPDTDRILLSWTDPAQTNMSKVAITWQAEGTAETAHSAQVGRGTQAYTISGLSSNTSYVITVAASDAGGVQSSAQSLTVRTLTPPPPDSGDTNVPPAGNGDTQIIGTTSAAGSKTAFGGMLQLVYGNRVFKDGAKVTLTQDTSGNAAVGPENRLISGVYTLQGDQGSEPKGKLALSIGWDPKAAKDIDPRRLAVYRRDDQNPQQWTYVGGALVDGQNRVEANIDRYGTYAVLLYEHPFADIQGHWSQAAVDVLVSRHIVQGIDGSHFNPDGTITRAHMAALLVNYLSGGQFDSSAATAGDAFTDVSSTAWYAGYIEKAFEEKLIDGYDGKFRPDDPVTREEMIVMLVRAFAAVPAAGGDAGTLQSFKDGASVSDWAKTAASWAVANGIVNGYDDGKLHPQSGSTRAEAAAVLFRLLVKLGIIVKK